jgi:hypothetical protein
MADEAVEPAAAPWDRTLESWNPITVVVLAVLGAVAAVALLLVGARETRISASFVDSPGFATWAAVLAAQSALWAVVTVPLWREIRTLYRATRPARSIWVVPGLIVGALALLALFSTAREAPWPLVGHQVKAWVLTTAAAGGVGVPAIFGICLVQDRVRRHRPDTMTTSDVDVALSARGQMRRFLGTAGTVIGLAVLASGALRLATVPDYLDESAFPATAGSCTGRSSPACWCWSTCRPTCRCGGSASTSESTTSRSRACHHRRASTSRVGSRGVPAWTPSPRST